ncbi:hypothetical protein HELRODRAFT_165342 [Helobdella robusta]|uniref:Endonuclease/exonuclease/phosphatase domain-containing protein n=1 Tax=Helobdella robusta TaxID=6412 RepID=T1EWM2_HELRO|nr:hypothetical protein HELRODRAFT_165342 [Helobdella robusta]ESN91328.1 hypothetical protein HELRODRAFT_165342 [Helobdella robusta]
MALSIWQKRVRRISGDPVHGVVVQGPVDGLATGTPLYSVAVQGTIDGRTTCRPRGWKFGTWNVGTLTGRSLEVVEELQRRMVDVAALQEIRWKGEGTRFVGAKGGRYKLWWKGDDGTGGVGVMAREELVEKTDMKVYMGDGDMVYGMRKGVECWSWRMHIAWWWGILGSQGNQCDLLLIGQGNIDR